MPVKEECKLIKKEKISEDIYKFSVETKDMVCDAKPRAICRNKNK